jgi:hypothetical protein
MYLLGLSLFILLIIIIFLIYHYYYTTKNSNYVEVLTRQASRWAVAAEQDQNPIIALLHANYAAGYLWALTDVASENEISKYVGDVSKFKKYITKIQDESVRNLTNKCPNLIPKNERSRFLSTIAGEI